jgi:hypothetical protein
MTHNLNHREQPVQKAGQKAGAAFPPSPNPSCVPRETTTSASREGTTSVVPYALGNQGASAPEATDAERVAGGETLSQKTSTAALDSFRRGPLRLQRRAPRQAMRREFGATLRRAASEGGPYKTLNEISILFFRRTS